MHDQEHADGGSMHDQEHADGGPATGGSAWASVPPVDSIRGADGAFDADGAGGAAGAAGAGGAADATAPLSEHRTPPYAPAPASAPAAAPAPARPRRKLSRSALVGIVAGGAAVVLLLVAGVVGYAVGTTTHSADRPVRAFLDDLTAGRVDDAIRTAHITRSKDDVLLTSASYAGAKDRVTGYRIARTEDDGDTATVTAYLRQGGRDVSATFTLDATSTDWGVFPVWELQAPTLGSVDVDVRGPAGGKVTIGGQTVTTSRDGSVASAAFPGTYTVAVDGGQSYSAPSGTARVSGFGASSSTPVTLTTTLTTTGQQAASRAVDAWVDACIASTDAAPKGCSFYAYGADSTYAYTNQRWTLDTRPVVTVGAWTSNGWLVTTTTFGRATYTADISGPGGVGTASAGPMNVNASGYITGVSAAGATFRSAVGNGSSDSGS